MQISRWFGILAFASVAAWPARAAEIVTVPSRPGVTQSYLLMADPRAQPKAVALLFPGGDGLLNLRKTGDTIDFDYKGNFLVRTRGLFRDADVAVAIIDVPSDLLRRGYSDAFRQGRDHAEDISAAVKDLRARFKGAKIFLVGTSRGTVSAAYLGRALGASVDGVVLTSTVSQATGGGTGLSRFDYRELRVPVLFVHHVDDGCRASPYRAVRDLGSSYPLVSVHGGKRAISDPCEAKSAHGYFGKEAETVDAIKSWMLGRAFLRTIE
jgi:hypothetical protein